MKKHVILIAVIVLVCACAVGLVAFALNSEEPNEGASDAGDVSDIVTDPTDEITEPITDKPTEPVTEPATEAPTEPATEAPTEPETEPETVPPTQPKVDFTYIARDTMLDGEEVEFKSGIDFEDFGCEGGVINRSLRFACNVHGAEEGDIVPNPEIGIMVINTYEEYTELCESYYNNILADYMNNLPKNWDRLYDSYTQTPQYQAYDREFFKDNDLIISNYRYITFPLGFGYAQKSGAELCIFVGIGLEREGKLYLTVVPRGGVKCYEISKSAMDGIDTISVYVHKTCNI